MIIHACISSMPTLWVARYNSIGSTLNMIGLVIVIILIPVGVHAKGGIFGANDFVWSIQNGTEYPDGVAILLCFLAIIWTTSGFDAPFHLSEECSNASIASPRAIVMTAAVGGVAGWFLQLVVAYTVIDIPGVIDSELGQPWASYVFQILPKNYALASKSHLVAFATIFNHNNKLTNYILVLTITILCSFSMGQGCMVAASRVTFAYARDDCLPFSYWIKKVNTITLTPVNAVWFNTMIGCLLLLLIFAGTTAIGAIFSVAAIAAYTAFTIPIFIRVFFVGDRFRRGPWHLGRFSTPIGVLACTFVLVMLPILCFPSTRGDDLTLETMNWTAVVYGGPMIIIMFWWLISAHKWFKGPAVNVEHAMLRGEGAVLHGTASEIDQDSSNGDDSAKEKVAR